MKNPRIEILKQDPRQLEAMLHKIDDEIILITKNLSELQSTLIDLKQDKKTIQNYLSYGDSDVQQNEKPMAEYYFG